MNKQPSTLKRLLIYLFFTRGQNMQREARNEVDVANYVQKEFTFVFTWCFWKIVHLIKALIKLVLYPITYLIKGPKNKKAAGSASRDTKTAARK